MIASHHWNSMPCSSPPPRLDARSASRRCAAFRSASSDSPPKSRSVSAPYAASAASTSRKLISGWTPLRSGSFGRFLRSRSASTITTSSATNSSTRIVNE